jgi:hypothetical protein
VHFFVYFHNPILLHFFSEGRTYQIKTKLGM